MKLSTRNILAVWDRATPESLAEGLAWYSVANQFARSLTSPAISLTQVCGVIAALSPQKSWKHNKTLAILAVTNGFASKHTKAMCAHADAILAGNHPLDVMKGPKTRDFFRCIYNPHDIEAVCIDRHAVSIGVGKFLGDRAGSVGVVLKRVGEYERVQRAYRRAATTIGNILPMQVQAVTWVQWRKEHAHLARGRKDD